MSDPAQQSERPTGALAGLGRFAQWLLLAAASLVLGGVLEWFRLPAALLVGPMLIGVACGIGGATIRAPNSLLILSQGVIGCLIAGAIEPDMLGVFLVDWPLVVAVVVITLAASSLLGAAIARWSFLPGTTAVWGSAPGAASAMVLMADAFGADARLVAFMQYLRVIIVSLSAALIAHFWLDVSGAEPTPFVLFPPFDPAGFAATVFVAVVGTTLGGLSRVPGGVFLGPMLLGAIVHLGFGVAFHLPEWLLALSYAIVGWSIGLRFTPQVLRHAARALPQILVSILLLIGFCAGMGAIIAPVFGIDPLTAFLATSPGGMDSVAIIAASTDGVDLSFVMMMQIARFIFVLVAGPPLARVIARRMRGGPPAS